MKIICFIIAILSIDLFNLLYKHLNKKYLNKLDEKEKTNEDGEEKIEYYKFIKWKLIYLKIGLYIYIFSVIFIGIYINFISKDFYENTNILNMLKNQFLHILFPSAIYNAVIIIVKYIQWIISFIKGFKDGLFQ